MMKELPITEISDKTYDLIARQGYCLWTLSRFNGQVISIVGDEEAIGKQLSFTDPLRLAAQYPMFTIPEVHELKSKSDEMIIRIIEIKKLAPARILLEKYEEIEWG